ncbi:MAG TPA: hypothetical protein VH062_01760 [Polyangiaceae bacterium]|jgi:hypothetical protein|nr:hypothetical protein [Polyangiaceae bacterium]
MLESILERYAEAGLSATAEALFPVNDLGAPDYRTTEVVARMLDYLRLLPARQRRLLLFLFAFVELAAPLLLVGFGRFSSLPVGRRERAVRRFRSSSVGPLRLVGDALKASTTMMYMSHPAALEYVGSYSGCGRVADTTTRANIE